MVKLTFQFKAVDYRLSMVGSNSVVKDHYSDMQNLTAPKSGLCIFCNQTNNNKARQSKVAGLLHLRSVSYFWGSFNRRTGVTLNRFQVVSPDFAICF